MLNNSCWSVAGSWILRSTTRGHHTCVLHRMMIKYSLTGSAATASCQGAYHASSSMLPQPTSQTFLQSRYTAAAAAALRRQPEPSRTVRTRYSNDPSKAAALQSFTSVTDTQHAGQQDRMYPHASPGSLIRTALHTASNHQHVDTVDESCSQSEPAAHAVQASVQQLYTDISGQQSMLASQHQLLRSSSEAQPNLSYPAPQVFLPIELVQIGIDPDTHGAIAVVRTQLHGYYCCQEDGGRRRANGHASSSINNPQQHISSNVSMTASSSIQVHCAQAFTGMPAAVRVYDMPAVETTTKSKTCTGKQRVRRRMDVRQGIDLIRQVLHDVVSTPLAAAALPPPAADIPGANDSDSTHQAYLALPFNNNANSSASSGYHAKAHDLDRKDSPLVAPGPITPNSLAARTPQQQLPLESPMGSSSTSSTNSSSVPSYILLRAAVEESNIQPSNGSFATRSQAYSVGAWTALLAAHGFDVTTVPVRKWKKDMQLFKRSKDCSRQLAQQLYQQAGAPQDHLLRTKNTHGRAEALLIAAWSLGWSATADLTPLAGPCRVPVSTTAASQSWNVVHAGGSSSSWPESYFTSAAGYTSSKDEHSARLISLPSTTASLSGSPVALVSRQHLQANLKSLGPHTTMLDVSSQMAHAQQAVLEQQAAKQREKQQRAAARKAAAEQRAAEQAQAKAERQAAKRLEQEAKAAARKAAAEQRAAEQARAQAERQAARHLEQAKKAAARKAAAERRAAKEKST